MDDFWEEPEAKQWVKKVLTSMAPKVEESALTVSLVPGDAHRYDEGDVKFWVELGASIMMNKPIIAVVFPGQSVPERLRRVADEIVEVDEEMGPESSDRMQAAMERILGPDA